MAETICELGAERSFDTASRRASSDVRAVSCPSWNACATVEAYRLRNAAGRGALPAARRSMSVLIPERDSNSRVDVDATSAKFGGDVSRVVRFERAVARSGLLSRELGSLTATASFAVAAKEEHVCGLLLSLE